MGKIKMFFKNYKLAAVLLVTAIYWLIIFFVYEILKPIESFRDMVDPIMWYYFMIYFMFFNPREDKKSNVEIYFNSQFMAEIKKIVLEQGFKEYKNTSNKEYFEKKVKFWFNDKIVIHKYENNVWSVSGKAEYLEGVRKFMVKYGR